MKNRPRDLRGAVASGVAVIAAVLLSGATAAAGIAPATANSLEVKWDFPAGQVTSSPVLANGLLYVSSWDGSIYALDPDDGSVTWSYDTGSAVAMGSQTTVLPTPGGDVCFGDSLINVTCLDGATGAVEWGPKSLGVPGLDNIWSGLATANGRLFVSISSILDTPCTKGRLVALDLATGADLWTRQTVPDRICTTDTSVECTTNADCGGAECVDAKGAGVTATVSFDPSGDFVYMNPVSCFTFPAIGDSDSILKLDAATGAAVWQTFVDPHEQFGFCEDDPSTDCSVDGHCSSGVCSVPKTFYHDFGFLNGPNPVDVPEGAGTKTLLVSANKNGTLYAFEEATGDIEWTNQVMPKPVTPGFAGFGLFNGPLAIADGMIYAALFQMIPNRVCDNDLAQACTGNTQCSGGTCLPVPDHLMAFDATDGSVVWTDDIGVSWSGVSAADGVVYAGTNTVNAGDGTSELFAYDGASGTRLAAYTLPSQTVSRVLVDGDSAYVGYGVFTPPGGVRAFTSRCPAVPATGCTGGQKASLQLRLRGGSKNQLKWKLGKGGAFDQADLDDPTAGAFYTACVYDETADVPSLVAAMVIDPGNGWQDKSPKGFKYKSKTGVGAGVTAARFKAGGADKTKVQIKATGFNLTLPTPVGADKFFEQDGSVVFQLVSSDSATCWTSEFPTSTKNTAEQFRAKAP